MVDCPTLEREVSGSKPTSGSAMLVLEQDMLLPTVLGIPRKHPDLTKKLLTETFSQPD